MSYSNTRVLGAVPIQVGVRAQRDPILAGASLAASKVMLARAKRGIAPDQASFDSLRLQIANERMERSIAQLASSRASGLGQWAPNDRATACTIAAGATVAGGAAQIIPVYGTIVGGILGIGSQIASGALDCTREQREAQAAQAAAEAQAAAAQLALAQQTAASAAARRQRQIRTFAIGGGGLLTILGVTWFLFK